MHISTLTLLIEVYYIIWLPLNYTEPENMKYISEITDSIVVLAIQGFNS